MLCKGDRNSRVFKESISIKYGKIVIFFKLFGTDWNWIFWFVNLISFSGISQQEEPFSYFPVSSTNINYEDKNESFGQKVSRLDWIMF